MSNVQKIRFEELGKQGYATVIAKVEIDDQGDGLWFASSVKVLEYWADDSHAFREERPDWFPWLDKVVENFLSDKNLCEMCTQTSAA